MFFSLDSVLVREACVPGMKVTCGQMGEISVMIRANSLLSRGVRTTKLIPASTTTIVMCEREEGKREGEREGERERERQTDKQGEMERERERRGHRDR